jgi:hypothetical protein
MEKSVSVIIVSTKKQEEKIELIKSLLDTAGCEVSILFVTNDGNFPLSKIFLNTIPKAKSDIVVLMHDDIEIIKEGWGAELIRLFDEHKDYGIIGVAGSADFDEGCAWWKNKELYGQVLHRYDGKSWLTAFSPLFEEGHDLEEVCVIDGVFMAIERTRIAEQFGEDIPGFDFYDVDFCLRNFLSKKTKIGVTTNIRICHQSVGQLKPQWYINRMYILDKFKGKFPFKVHKGFNYGKKRK